MKKQFTKRILSWFLAAVMALGMVAPMGAANTSDAAKTKETELIVEKVDNDAVSVALGDKITDEATDEEPAADEVVRVSIILKDAATTAKFSTEDIAKNKEAIQYRAALAEKQESMAQKISKEVLGGQDLDIVWNLTLAANLISANVAYGDVAAIEKIPGVQEVVLETRYEPMVVKTEDKADPNTATSGVMTGTFSAYAEGYTGAGSRVAIIDTGIDTDHQSFDNDAFLYSLKEGGYNVDELNLLDVEEIASVLAELNASEKYAGLTAEDLYRNEKEPYNFNYIDKNLDVQHIQSDEHGAHVAGIAAANAYIPDGKGGFVSALDSVKVQGAAPDAQILTMRVFGQGGGAYDSDYMAAIEDAVILGCDSVNLSLGSGNPGFSRSATAAYAKIMDDLQDSGTVVTMSAGNSGYWAENASPVGYLYAEDVSMQMDGSPGSYDNSLAVASADNIGFTGSYLTVDGSNVFYTETSYTNKPITTIGGDHEFVYVDGNGTDADFAAVADKLAGKIALCNRGGISFYEKAENAVKHGAIATIVVNNQAGTINMDLSDYTKTAPVISITQADGALVKAAATSEETIGGNTVYFGTLTVGSDVGSAITADHVTMSSFSSWGVPGSLTLKPEITAPGGSIYSVNGAIAGGTSYETMSGTSMAAPQIAGITALMAQYVRDNDLVAKTGLDQRTLIQSLLMSTAEPLFDNDNEGAYYYPVLQQGAGLVNVGAAVKAESYILMDESSTDSAADGKVKAELGDDPDRTGKYTVKFTVNNISGEEMNYVLAANMFTQAPFAYYVNADKSAVGYYMDTLTTPVGADVEWLVDGVAAEAPDYDLLDMDFDGNGVINDNDADAMLDYVVGNRTSLNDEENADLDGDGEITSYDVYLFLQRLSAGAFTVPANGSVEIVANISLDPEDMEAIDSIYENGAYVEGYIYVKSLTSDDGEIGVTHSIPVLGFYGDWSDPSMYEHGQRITYITGEDPYTPYLGSMHTNTLGINYAWDDSGTYFYTGNPLLVDFYNAKVATKYLPERNAINSADTLALWRISLIRNAAQMHLTVADENGNKLVDQSAGTNVASAYYYTNGSAWKNTTASMNLKLSPAALGLSEGDKFSVKLSGATEYSVDENGNVAWDELGDGASQEYSFTVDDTAPVLKKVTLEEDIMNGGAVSMNVTASDNQYIAGVILTNGSGSKVYSMAAYDEDAQPGETTVFELPLDGVNGNKFMIQVVDYAYNTSTYIVRKQIGEKPEVPQALVYYYDFYIDFSTWSYGYKGELHSLAFDADGKTSLEDATVYADMENVFDETALAMEDVDGILVTSFSDGTLYALRTADPLDGTLIADLGEENYFTDFAYADDTLYGVRDGKLYSVNILDGTVAPAFADDTNVYTTLAGKDDAVYATTVSGDEVTIWKLVAGKDAEEVTKLTLAAGVAPLSMDFYGNDLYALSTKKGSYSNTYYLYKLDLTAGTAAKVNTDSLYQDELYCLVFPDQNGDESWTIPGDDVTASSLTIDQGDSVRLIRGGSTQLTVTVMPWILDDKTADWSTSDADVATVNANGKVTGVANGTATITATSKDGAVSDTIEVEVYYPEVTFEGALQDKDGKPLIFKWDAANEETWEKVADLDTTVSAAAASDDKYFVMNFEPSSAPAITSIDKDTLEVIDQKFGDANDVAYWDMAYSVLGSGKATDLDGNVWEDNILGVYGYFLITGDTTPSTLAFNFQSNLSRMGATCFLTIANAGLTTYYDDDADVTYDAENFVLLDDAGNVWSLLYFFDETEKDFIIAVDNVYTTKLQGDEFAMFEDGDFLHYLTSMVADDNYAKSKVLYIASYNKSAANTARIFRLDLNDGTAAVLGNVGDDVWPAALFSANEIPASTGTTSIHRAPAKVQNSVAAKLDSDVLTVEEIGSTDLAQYLIDKAAKVYNGNEKTSAKNDTESFADTMAEIAARGKYTGSLNGFTGTVRPNSTVTVDKEDTNVILNLTAKDADGNDIASHNGKSVVSYDTNTLKLISVNSVAAHYAYNDANGVITFAYADLATIEAGEPVATFVFERLSGKEAGLTIDYKEVNNQKIGVSEDITEICQHERTIIKNAVPATPFRPGYTGDKYCAICGKLLARGQYLPILIGPAYPTNPKDDTPKGDDKPVEPKPVEEPETEPTTPVVPEKELPFVDVVKDHWFYNDVLYVYENGLMNGVSDTEFAPNETLTRAMVVTILSRMSGEEIDEATESAFSDVATGMWYSNAIAWAASKNIVNGFEDGTFQPDAPVTRAQLVTILYRYAQYKGMDVSTLSDLAQFTDAADVPAYALEAMQWAVGSELISGNGLLIDASANATRAQVAAIIHRFLTK